MALLIGNARYKTAPLVNPIHDVRLLGGVLASLGFEVTCVENATRTKLRESVEDFAARLEEIGRDGVAFFYFAGHGIQDGGVNFLLPIDLELASRPHLRARALAVDEVVTQMARSPRKANVIVLDACRTPPKDVVAQAQDLTQGLAALKLPPDGMLVVYSTAVGALAEDGKTANSPYSAALAQALPGVLEPDRRLHDVFVEAAERVKTDTEGRQNPALYLQGALPPLAVTEADRERFRTWVFRRPKTWRERIFQWVGIIFLTVVILIFPLALIGVGPEGRSKLLHDLHIVRAPHLFEFSCQKPNDVKDRFGLTRLDWCTKDVADLVPIVKAAGLWESAVIQQVANGDPGAMVLHSGEIASRDPGPGKLAEEALRFAVRAAKVGWLPAWPEVSRQFYASRNNDRLTSAAKILAGLQAGARAGVTPAWIEAGLRKWSEGDIKIASRIFENADKRDPSGKAALTFGQQLMLGSAKGQVGPNIGQAAEWFRKACRKGAGGALKYLDVLGAQQVITFTTSERAACVKRVIEAGGPDADFLRGMNFLDNKPKNYAEQAEAEFLRAAEAGHVEAMIRLGILHTQRLLGEKSQQKLGLTWLRKAEAKGNIRAKTLVGEALAWGLPDAEGRPLIKVDVAAGRDRMQQALSSYDALAGIGLARLYETGALARRNPREVIRLANSVKNIGAGIELIRLTADIFLKRAENELKLAYFGNDKITLGKRTATIKVVLLIPWGCGHCIDFTKNEMKKLVEEYVDAGIVELELRPVYSGDTAERAALASEFLRCAPAGEIRANYFLKLLEEYPLWSELPVEAKGGRLRELAQPLFQAAACAPDDRRLARIRSGSAKQAERWGVKGDLIVAVNGEMLTRPALDRVRSAIYQMAGPEIRPNLKKP